MHWLGCRHRYCRPIHFNVCVCFFQHRQDITTDAGIDLDVEIEQFDSQPEAELVLPSSPHQLPHNQTLWAVVINGQLFWTGYGIIDWVIIYVDTSLNVLIAGSQISLKAYLPVMPLSLIWLLWGAASQLCWKFMKIFGKDSSRMMGAYCRLCLNCFNHFPVW